MKVYGSFDDTAAPGSAPAGMYVPLNFDSLVTLGKRTRDGRLIDAEGFEPFELPLSIQMKLTDGPGHDGSVIMGRLDEVTVHDDGNVTGRGWALNDENGRKGAFLIKTKALRGNSVDLSVREEDVDVRITESASGALSFEMDFRNARLQATTVLPKPAFQDSGATVSIPDEWAVDGVEDVEAVTASSEWVPVAFNVVSERPKIDAGKFTDPALTGPTPLYVDEGERIIGHIAAWDAKHLSQGGIKPPRSRTNYAYFANKHVLTTDGQVSTGVLTIGGEHAPHSVGWMAAIDHYANTCAAWGDVAIGEDEFGIWVSGIVRPGTSDEVLHAARGSVPSGDWRRIGANLELIASLNVNTGGFPIARAFGHDENFALALFGAGALARPAVATSFADESFKRDIAFVAQSLATQEARAIAEALEAE